MKRATELWDSMDEDEEISIHALVKRATGFKARYGLNANNFNPRPREEGDQDYGKDSCTMDYFNPRPREEGD